MNHEIKEFRDLEQLSKAVAENISDLINEIVRAKGAFTLVLSGGNTPRTLYQILATAYDKATPWRYVQIFFGDERYVPHDDKQSNYRMVKENLLDLISIPPENVHSVRTDLPDPNEAAHTFENELRKYFPNAGNAFDLVLLGIGKEGHTASLFPNSPSLDERRRWAAAVEIPATPAKRITLTYPILNRSSVIYFLISGIEKREAFQKVTGRASEFHTYPAAGVNPIDGRLVWWVDSAAAGD